MRGRLLAALLLMGGSVVAAQQPVAPRDSSARPVAVPRSPLDTLLPRGASERDARDSAAVDSAALRRKRIAADTIKAPLAHAERPMPLDDRWHWSGAALRDAGAVTLADLLARIPGVSAFRANWIPAAQFIAWNGDAGRVRVFLDGVELDAIDPRNGGVLDLGVMPLWQLEDVVAERAAGELRVHLRSWRVDHTTPFTRTDITSGSENTNLYRGYFGKRLTNGGVIQLAAQQSSTASPRTGGDGTGLQVFGRLGWARKRWSVDATWNRATLDRAATVRFPQYSTITQADGSPAFKGSLGSAYARIAWGDPDAKSAPWIQLIAATQMVAENSKVSTTTSLSTPATAIKDTVDSATSRSQYVLAAGASRWGLSGSVTARLRAGGGRTDLSPSARLAFARSFVSLAAFAETRGADSTRRLDLTARIAPWRWLVLDGAYGVYTPRASVIDIPAFTASRVVLGTRVFGLSLSGGLATRGQTSVAAPVALDSSLVRVTTGAVKGAVFEMHRTVYRDLSFAVSGIRWEGQGAYRPQMEIHSSLTLDSSFPGKFPRSNFHMLASAMYDHRTPMFFPTRSGGIGATTTPLDVLSARLEFRIESGTVFIQGTNLTGKIYDTAPGYVMPRNMQYYGIRWEFWN